jgi:hypothetical protein
MPIKFLNKKAIKSAIFGGLTIMSWSNTVIGAPGSSITPFLGRWNPVFCDGPKVPKLKLEFTTSNEGVWFAQKLNKNGEAESVQFSSEPTTAVYNNKYYKVLMKQVAQASWVNADLVISFIWTPLSKGEDNLADQSRQ